MNKLKQELFISKITIPLEETVELLKNQNHMTKISEITSPRKSSIDKVSQHLACLYDKAIDAEDSVNQANQEEILY